MWVPPEIKDPILRHAPTRKSVACFGAVSLSSGQFVRMMCPIFNAATFQSFLKRLLHQQTPGRRMLLVLDNARYHHAKLLAPYLRCHARDLRLLFLPPYSPQLAPIERVWKLTRRLQLTTATLPRCPRCSRRSTRASTGGADRTTCYGDYAALLKSECVFSEFPSEVREYFQIGPDRSFVTDSAWIEASTTGVSAT